MLYLVRNNLPSERTADSWKEDFFCTTCGAEFAVGFNTAKYCPMCRSDKITVDKPDYSSSIQVMQLVLAEETLMREKST
jgi:Zn finger protein HypA/HybF involved in hydrogenase expression